MELAYATSGDYTDWLNGRNALIPLTEFDFWADRASEMIDAATFDRLHNDDALADNKQAVIATTCAVAELLFGYQSEDAPKTKTSMSIGNYSESYASDSVITPYARLQGTITRGLGRTGLLYRGMR